MAQKIYSSYGFEDFINLLLLACSSQSQGLKVARPRDELDLYTVDGDTTNLKLHNLGMELEEREIFSSALHCGSCCDIPQDFRTHSFNKHLLSVYSDASNPGTPVWSPML
ncbi:hypothetical protein TNCV_1067001 [Trichonephila clavipes]|uniref:Uncharacterized protein n=1 Tax=Trichonephila clavipes TaxID=2585209 RepID=A0A8X6RA32_TRICX|nr:hypothetical protein TNCV_1067001 [Trichonephila clavipes]